MVHDPQQEDNSVISTPVGTRRRFFEWVTKIAMGVIGVGLAVPLIGYVVGPALKRRESTWNEIGPIDNLRSGEPEELEFVNTVKDGWRTASVKKAVWAIKQPAGPVVVFSPICPHLGCGFRWESSRPVVVLAGTIFLVTIFILLGISIRDLHALPKLDPSVARGKVLFAQNHCLACHGLHGEGGKVGPDLSYVGNRRTDRDWHIRHLRDPASVSPGSIMPKFPLSDREMNDLASYLLSLKAEAAGPAEGTLETDEMEYAAYRPGSEVIGPETGPSP